MNNCKKKCPLKASRFTDEYTLGYCDGIERGRIDGFNNIADRLKTIFRQKKAVYTQEEILNILDRINSKDKINIS